MIPAAKDPLLDAVLYWYLKRLVSKHFHAVKIAGLKHLQGLEKTRPAIGFANHSNWWDGLMIFFLTRYQRGKDFYCMMEEKQMLHYPFFSWIGAFSVDLDNSLRAAATVRYACNLLRQNRSLIWIFPQGAMVAPHDPIKIKPGVDFLARRYKNAQMLPVALHYEFGREQRPFAYIRIGAPYLAGDNSDERLADELTRLRDLLHTDLRSGNLSEYQTLLKPSWSINKRWEWIRRALRGDLKGFNPEN